MPRQCLGIIGIDTDAGKTAITAALAKAGHNKGKSVLMLKPVQTGCLSQDDASLKAIDLCTYEEAAPLASMQALIMLEHACSPHLAIEIAGKKSLSAQKLVKDIQAEISANKAEIVLIEGAGGLLTPLNETESLADVFRALGFPLILVVANKLGAINHALLTLEVANKRGLNIIGFVMTETQPMSHALTNNNLEQVIQQDNAKCITRMTGVPCLATIKHIPQLQHQDLSMRQKGWDILAAKLEPILDILEQAQCQKNSQQQSKDIIAYDQKHIWHPYTSALNPLPLWQAISTQGVKIRLHDGRELIDGMASWWCAIHGYNHPALMDALHTQAGHMPHVMFGGLTHEPAVNLAKKLLAVAPANLEHVFFADSGSVAVEIALKMAIQYQQACGQTKRINILAFRGGYHGDTLGAMSVCDPENSMHSLFKGILPQQIFAPRPECPFNEPYNTTAINDFERILQEQGASIAAVIIEPIVQGAGGMWFYHPEYLQHLSSLCKEHGCLLIFDEIATGFGRTGKYFACEHALVQPDILCLGKGLTGGVISLAATLTSNKVATNISKLDSATQGIFMHGPTFMANPLACAVATASLELLANNEWETSVKNIEQALKTGLKPCLSMFGVEDVRILGAIGVVQMQSPVNVTALQNYFVNTCQVWIRPFAKLIYIMPPYCATAQDIKILTAAICNAVEQKIWQ